MDDRTLISRWAASLLEADNFVVLDTETTGLERYAEIIEIALIDKTGRPLLDTLLKPEYGIPAEAIAVHGITEEMTRHAPTFPDVWPTLLTILRQRPHLLIYNADYDFPLLWNAAKRYALRLPTLSYQCLMKLYAHYKLVCRRPSACRCRWQKLEVACSDMGIPVFGQHRALADARLTLRLLQALANSQAVNTAFDSDVFNTLPV